MWRAMLCRRARAPAGSATSTRSSVYKALITLATQRPVRPGVCARMMEPTISSVCSETGRDEWVHEGTLSIGSYGEGEKESLLVVYYH